eukprot:sb/3476009/
MPWGGKYFSLPSFIVVGLIYRGIENVPGLIKIPLEEVTTIELHLAKWSAQNSQITEVEAAELTEINVTAVRDDVKIWVPFIANITIRSFGARDRLGLSVRVWLGFGLVLSVRANDSLSVTV